MLAKIELLVFLVFLAIGLWATYPLWGKYFKRKPPVQITYPQSAPVDIPEEYLQMSEETIDNFIAQLKVKLETAATQARQGIASASERKAKYEAQLKIVEAAKERIKTL